MENDIAFIATGYVLARIGILVTFAYLIYRVLSRKPSRVRVKSQRHYAIERLHGSHLDR